MACPACGCKETYSYDPDDEGDIGMERCAACHVIFDFEDHAPEDDDGEFPSPAEPGGNTNHGETN